ncbi:MAG: hypothetical protein QMC67_03625 [Candidatus Wallbacteria bacterium]
MITPDMTPMFMEEIFKVNLYCNDSEIIEFNKLIEDAEKNCLKIKEFVDSIFIPRSSKTVEVL